MNVKDTTSITGIADLKDALWHTLGPIGEPLITEQQPIVLSVGDQKVTAELRDMITVGRKSDADTGWPPEVDLSAFDATKQGVSRQHVRLTRKNNLIYVSDLGSTNGTLLNGHAMLPNAERLLRSGDELQLGFLKLKVRFGVGAEHNKNEAGT